MRELRDELERILQPRQILVNEPLGRHTTFRVGGPADFYLMPDAGQLSSVMALLKERDVPVTVIGNGSNLLVADSGIRGAVVEIGSRMSDVSVKGGTVLAQAGALLSQAAQAALKSGLSGLEFAAGIPGSVGGAMVMNAGAYGGEMKDVVRSVTVLDGDGNARKLNGAQLEFCYRSSCIQNNGYLALEAEFALSPSDPEEIRRKMDDFKERRVSKQPLSYPSAGSTFKRPPGHFAGKLIMDAGLAGYSVGGAQVSAKHCGFVINAGGATAADILAVIRHVQQVVFEQFGVELKAEVKMLGQF